MQTGDALPGGALHDRTTSDLDIKTNEHGALDVRAGDKTASVKQARGPYHAPHRPQQPLPSTLL